MRRLLFPILLVLAAACAHPKSNIEYAQGADINHFHRIGVLPFNDRHGLGGQISQAVSETLAKHGFEIVDSGALIKIFAKYKPDAEAGMGITELTELKQATRADALISGLVDPSGGQAVMIMVDTDLGDEVFKATLFPRHGRAFKDQKEIIDQAVGLFADLPSPGK